MSRIIVTIFEETIHDAVEAIRAVGATVDGFEIRVDAFDPEGESSFDPTLIRRASDRLMIYTRRTAETCTASMTLREVRRALEAGFDYVDVELDIERQSEMLELLGGRAILSHHDFKGCADAARTSGRLREAAKRTKIAVTPRSFGENLDLLRLLADSPQGSTLIGMGDRGLYSRILAPFFGSDLIFVARDPSHRAAPGQLTLESARAIYGADPGAIERPQGIFAVVGHPVAHSQSPSFHNERFRALGVSAAYTMADVESFDEILDPFVRGDEFAPIGLSVTAPFKVDAWKAAVDRGWELGPEGYDCGSVNTLVRHEEGRFVARNTDAEGFLTGLRLANETDPPHVAVIGAGGTGRAAAWAAREAGFEVTVFNRTPERAEQVAADLGVRCATLTDLATVDAGTVICTVTAGADFEMPRELLRAGRLLIDVSYAEGAKSLTERARAAGMTVFDGLDLLQAQAYTQSKLFVDAANHLNRMVQ